MRKLILIFFVLISQAVISQTVVTNSTGTAADEEYGGTSWSNAGNVYTSNNVYATNACPEYGFTNMIRATNFGFSIPTGATITSIIMKIECKSTEEGNFYDGDSYIILPDGTDGAPSYNAGGVVIITTSDVVYEFYGTDPNNGYELSETWGRTWTAADINDADFGFRTMFYRNTTLGNKTIYVDNIEIEVTYTESGGGGGVAISKVNGVAQASISKVNTVTSSTGINKINGVANK
jgi:hypothetical protein